MTSLGSGNTTVTVNLILKFVYLKKSMYFIIIARTPSLPSPGNDTQKNLFLCSTRV